MKLTNEEEQRIIQLYKEGKSYKELLSSCNYSLMTIYNVLKRNNIPRTRETCSKKTPEDVKKILELYFIEKKTQVQIADIMGISAITVRKYLKIYKNIIIQKGIFEVLKELNENGIRKMD